MVIQNFDKELFSLISYQKYEPLAAISKPAILFNDLDNLYCILL
jgi:hypothetical protein